MQHTSDIFLYLNEPMSHFFISYEALYKDMPGLSCGYLSSDRSTRHLEKDQQEMNEGQEGKTDEDEAWKTYKKVRGGQ